MSAGPIGTPMLTRATSGSVTGSWGTGQNRTAGDLLVAVVTAGGTAASAAAISTPSGWTQVTVTGNTAGSANAWVAAYTKVAAGSDAAPAFTATLSGTVAMTCTLFELAAANNFWPVDAFGVYGSGGSAGTLSAMAAATATAVSAAGGYAIAAFCQEASAAVNTWNGAGGSWSNAVNDGSTSSVLHTAVDVLTGPSVNAALSETGHWSTDTSAFGAGLILVIAAQSGGFEAYTNDASTTITSGGTDAPVSGTPEFWTGSWAGFPVADNTAFPPVKFHVADTASGASGEIITVLNTTTGLVARGAFGTTPVAHSAPFTVAAVLTSESSGNLPQTYNVRQSGATGNGRTDDYTALQDSLTKCRLAGGGTVHVPAGTYLSSQIPQIGSNTRLTGDGKGVSVIRVVSNMNPVQIGSLCGITGLQAWGEQAASNVIIEDLTIDGNEAGNASIPSPFSSGFSAAIRLDNIDKLLIRNVEVVNAILYSIWLNNCTHFEVSSCKILSGQNAGLGYNDQDGIHVTNSQVGIISLNNVDTGTTYGVGDDAICLQSLTTSANGGSATGGGGPNPSSSISITGNTIRSAARGISLLFGGAPVSNVSIAGNVIWGTQSDGIILAWDILGSGVHTAITITGNTLRNIGAAGAGNGVTLMNPGQISGSGPGWADVAICGNTLDGFTAGANFGIYGAGGTGWKVSDNVLDGWNAETGIQAGDNYSGTSEPVTDFSISGNTVNMSASTVTGATGIAAVDSSTGTINGNTCTGNGTSGSLGIGLGGVDATNIVSGITIADNTLTNWAAGVQEVNFGANPDYNIIQGNNLHGCTTGVTVLGPHTLSQQPVPDIGGVGLTEQFACLASSYTLANSTSAQKLFNASASGALTVPSSVLFFFEAVLSITGLSGSAHTIDFGFGGTATYTSVSYEAQTATAAGGAASLFSVATASATAITASTTGTVLQAVIRGAFRVNAGGTVIPQITQATAATAASVGAGSYFRAWPVGAGSAAYAGNWS